MMWERLLEEKPEKPFQRWPHSKAGCRCTGMGFFRSWDYSLYDMKERGLL